MPKTRKTAVSSKPPQPKYKKAIKFIQDAEDLARTGALTLNDGEASIFFMWGQPAHATFTQADGTVAEGDRALPMIAVALGTAAKVAWIENQVIQQSTLRCTADELIDTLERLEGADEGASPPPEAVAAKAASAEQDVWEGVERRGAAKITYTYDNFPVTPTGPQLWAEVPTNVIHMDVLLGSMPLVIVRFDAPSVKGVGIVRNHELTDAMIVEASTMTTGKAAWDQLLTREDGVVSAFEITDDVAKVLPMLWRNRVIYRDIDTRWVNAEAMIRQYGYGSGDRGVIVKSSKGSGVALFDNGSLTTVYTTANPLPSRSLDAILPLFTADDGGTVMLIIRDEEVESEAMRVSAPAESPYAEPEHDAEDLHIDVPPPPAPDVASPEPEAAPQAPEAAPDTPEPAPAVPDAPTAAPDAAPAENPPSEEVQDVAYSPPKPDMDSLDADDPEIAPLPKKQLSWEPFQPVSPAAMPPGEVSDVVEHAAPEGTEQPAPQAPPEGQDSPAPLGTSGLPPDAPQEPPAWNAAPEDPDGSPQDTDPGGGYQAPSWNPAPQDPNAAPQDPQQGGWNQAPAWNPSPQDPNAAPQDPQQGGWNQAPAWNPSPQDPNAAAQDPQQGGWNQAPAWNPPPQDPNAPAQDPQQGGWNQAPAWNPPPQDPNAPAQDPQQGGWNQAPGGNAPLPDPNAQPSDSTPQPHVYPWGDPNTGSQDAGQGGWNPPQAPQPPAAPDVWNAAPEQPQWDQTQGQTPPAQPEGGAFPWQSNDSGPEQNTGWGATPQDQGSGEMQQPQQDNPAGGSPQGGSGSPGAFPWENQGQAPSPEQPPDPGALPPDTPQPPLPAQDPASAPSMEGGASQGGAPPGGFSVFDFSSVFSPMNSAQKTDSGPLNPTADIHASPMDADSVNYDTIVDDLIEMARRTLDAQSSVIEPIILGAEKSAPGIRQAIRTIRQTQVPGCTAEEINTLAQDMATYVADRLSAL